MNARPELDALSARLGIVPVYFDLAGHERRASEATREALIAAMGHDASSEDSARRAVQALQRAAERRLLDEVQVWREHASDLPRVLLRPGRGSCNGHLRVDLEDGTSLDLPLALAAGREGTLSVRLPRPIGPGYHVVQVELSDGRSARQLLIVAPRTAPTAAELFGARRAFGVSANLYSVRGERGLGCGDFTDLDELSALVANWGGDFVTLNPLHALRNRGQAISPYSPVSRQWRNLIYIDIERIPEFERFAGGRTLDALVPTAERLRKTDQLDYEGVLESKLGLLRELHGVFRQEQERRPSVRGKAYAHFVEEAGEALQDFATFEALAERFDHELDWRRWPEPFRDPRSEEVTAFRRDLHETVELYRWIQFELDRQLARTAEHGRAAGLTVGIVNDLAVGSPPDSADAWSQPNLFARGVSIGAPPDAFTAEGQDWGLAPIDPNRLRADEFRLWSRLLRDSFRHAGGLRIDHAIGLERSFWIPEGRPGSEGAYVRQPADELLGILALEARRAGTLVIGEDLGVVPVGLKRRLASWGLLSTSVLMFEREGADFRAPQRYSPRALLTATTHDLVPLAGYAPGTDLELRASLEDLDADQYQAAREARGRDVADLSRALDSAGLERAPGEDEVGVERVHRFLARTPSPLVALALDDLAGEHEPINLPGISTARHRSWSRRMARPLKSIRFDPESMAERVRPLGTGSETRNEQDDAL